MDPITRQGISVAAGASGGEGLYVDEVFSTFLYEGNGSTQSINNGIDISGEGGLVWIKNRSSAIYGGLWDTERGANKRLRSDSDIAEATANNILTSFNSNGFSVSTTGGTQVNNSGDDYASWSFRKAPGFFDVVTYSGSDSAQTIAHNLGSVPGMIILKCTTTNRNWRVYHRSMGATYTGQLNGTNSFFVNSGMWNNTEPTSTAFTVGTSSDVNASGHTYVAYLFAHDDQSFGTNGNEAIIKCGSFSYTGGTPLNVDLGWEAQWVLAKRTDGTDSWYIADVMRGMIDGDGAYLQPNTSNSEGPYGIAGATSTGFIFDPGTQIFSSGTYIYMAIRRPHKPPTAGTEVFAPQTTTPDNASWTPGFAPDTLLTTRPSGTSKIIGARLTGAQSTMSTDSSSSETSGTNYLHWDEPTGTIKQTYFQSSNTGLHYAFKRAPGFFDVVAYTGTNTVRTINHNLSVVPELMIIKNRNRNYYWTIYVQALGNGYQVRLPNNNAKYTTNDYNSTDPTSSVFTVGSTNVVNESGYGHIAYLFASLDGVSKVGSYSGTGSNINVDCGFTAGARFVLIKRTDSSGDWYVWDTARGIVSGNDPYILLNNTAGEVTNTDYIDPLNAGFTVTSSAPAALNASGGTYLFLAIA